ncbi:hypothetical protein LJR260_000666 [Variovorax paradoxus]|uniref:hypothetical protein n=1 Tax=Variovorax paradoxus TaxID=34073 RepID=UPI003ECF7858
MDKARNDFHTLLVDHGEQVQRQDFGAADKQARSKRRAPSTQSGYRPIAPAVRKYEYLLKQQLDSGNTYPTYPSLN